MFSQPSNPRAQPPPLSPHHDGVVTIESFYMCFLGWGFPCSVIGEVLLRIHHRQIPASGQLSVILPYWDGLGEQALQKSLLGNCHHIASTALLWVFFLHPHPQPVDSQADHFSIQFSGSVRPVLHPPRDDIASLEQLHSGVGIGW